MASPWRKLAEGKFLIFNYYFLIFTAMPLTISITSSAR